MTVCFHYRVPSSFVEKGSQHPIHIARDYLGNDYATFQNSDFAGATQPEQVRVIFPRGDTGKAHIYAYLGKNNHEPYLQLRFDGDHPRIPGYLKKADELVVILAEVTTYRGFRYYAILEFFEKEAR